MYNPYTSLLAYKLRKAYCLFGPGNFVVPDLPYFRREISVATVLKKQRHLALESFLNIGFHSWDEEIRHWWIKICQANKIDWHILEAFEENVKESIELGCSADQITWGNILDIESYRASDCLLFWHGPEHIEKEAFLKALPKIESKAKKLIIFGMPIGDEPQDEAYGNPYEKHVSSWRPGEWSALGYQVIPVYDRKKYPHMTVYKVL